MVHVSQWRVGLECRSDEPLNGVVHHRNLILARTCDKHWNHGRRISLKLRDRRESSQRLGAFVLDMSRRSLDIEICIERDQAANELRSLPHRDAQQWPASGPSDKRNAARVDIEGIRMSANVVESITQIDGCFLQQGLWVAKPMCEHHGDHPGSRNETPPGLKEPPIFRLVLRTRGAVN